MNKHNPHMAKRNKDSSFEDLSKLIIATIEDEKFFNKKALIPKVKAVLSGFKINVAAAKYNKIESPTDAAKRLRLIEQEKTETRYWKDQVKKIIGEAEMEEFYHERDAYLKEHGFGKKVLIPEHIPEFQQSIDNMSEESKAKVDNSMQRCEYELLVEEYYGVKLKKEDKDPYNLVDFACFVHQHYQKETAAALATDKDVEVLANSYADDRSGKGLATLRFTADEVHSIISSSFIAGYNAASLPAADGLTKGNDL